MPNSKAHILSTAALPQSLIDKGRENDMIIDVISFTDIKPTINKEFEDAITGLISKKLNVVFTSTNAVEKVINKLQSQKPDWKIYCTAGNTKKTIGNYFGEELIAGTGVNAISVAEKILRDQIKEVIFFCGNQRRQELPSTLSQHGITVHEVVVYDTALIPQSVGNDYNGILFFSPSAVKSYFSTNEPGKNVILFAIGNTTAESIKKKSPNKVIICESPEKEMLIQLAIGYFENHPVHYLTHDQSKK